MVTKPKKKYVVLGETIKMVDGCDIYAYSISEDIRPRGFRRRPNYF